jgi:hypothetical protein
VDCTAGVDAVARKKVPSLHLQGIESQLSHQSHLNCGQNLVMSTIGLRETNVVKSQFNLCEVHVSYEIYNAAPTKQFKSRFLCVSGDAATVLHFSTTYFEACIVFITKKMGSLFHRHFIFRIYLYQYLPFVMNGAKCL